MHHLAVENKNHDPSILSARISVGKTIRKTLRENATLLIFVKIDDLPSGKWQEYISGFIYRGMMKER